MAEDQVALAPLAVIYVPSLGSSDGNQLDDVAERIAKAFDLGARDPSREFGADRLGSVVKYGDRLSSQVRSVHEVVDGKHQPVLDLYELAYADTLTDRQAKRSTFRQFTGMLIATVSAAGRLLRTVGRPSSSGKSKVQLLLGIVLLVIFVAYVLVLALALVDTVARVADDKREISSIQVAALALSGVAAAVPAGFRRALHDVAVKHVSAHNYLASGTHRPEIIGQGLALIDRVAALGYREICIVAYSFGTIIALDTLFPAGGPAVAAAGNVQSLITIGCPFDLVRTYFPTYYGERNAGSEALAWTNVWAPLDALSSNFRNDARHERATISIVSGGQDRDLPTNLVWDNGATGIDLKWYEVVLFTGLRAHSMYWERGPGNDLGCFAKLTARLAPPNLELDRAPKPAPVRPGS